MSANGFTMAVPSAFSFNPAMPPVKSVVGSAVVHQRAFGNGSIVDKVPVDMLYLVDPFWQQFPP
jgi:hypothetical protein